MMRVDGGQQDASPFTSQGVGRTSFRLAHSPSSSLRCPWQNWSATATQERGSATAVRCSATSGNRRRIMARIVENYELWVICSRGGASQDIELHSTILAIIPLRWIFEVCQCRCRRLGWGESDTQSVLPDSEYFRRQSVALP